MRWLNLGILAHVDAGKTSLTERLLYAAGVIDAIGSVDDGNTQTDFLELERQRGITIKSAVVSFVVGDVTVNLIDTPGHPDFIAEVERVLNVLDAVVLVISAVEGVQAQTRVLMRTLKRLNIPVILFVNKIDRRGAQFERLLEAIATKLTPAILAMGAVPALGTRGADFAPYDATDAAFLERLAAVLAEHDDTLLAAYAQDASDLPCARLYEALAAQTQRALVHPVFFGSAITGAGTAVLIDGIKTLLPKAVTEEPGTVTEGSDPSVTASGTVFKVERGDAGEKIAFVRVFFGTIHTRDRVKFGSDKEAKVTAIGVFELGSCVSRGSVHAGQIGKLWGLHDIRIGDVIGAARTNVVSRHFASPTLQTVVTPRQRTHTGALYNALMQLAEQDPLINVRQDDVRQEIFVSLYGEVQKEVIQATLAADFGIETTFHESTVICVERPIGTGAAVEVIKQSPNPFLATVGLRVAPATVGTGMEFRRADDVLGTMPIAFFRAVEDAVTATLRQGLYGWPVIDCVVTLTHTGYYARHSHSHALFDKSMSSTGADFRNLTPLVLMNALKQAGTVVCEPMHRLRLEIPADTLATLLNLLARLGAIALTPTVVGAACTVEGAIPAARVHELQQQLPALTRGEGLLESAFDHYQSVRGTPPSQRRADANPLNRREYLLRVAKRM